MLLVAAVVGVATCFLHIGSWGRVTLGRAMLLGSLVSHSAVATATLPARVLTQQRLPPPPLCGQVLIGASNVWTGAFNTVRTSLKEGVRLGAAGTNATQGLCTQAWASCEATHWSGGGGVGVFG